MGTSRCAGVIRKGGLVECRVCPQEMYGERCTRKCGCGADADCNIRFRFCTCKDDVRLCIDGYATPKEKDEGKAQRKKFQPIQAPKFTKTAGIWVIIVSLLFVVVCVYCAICCVAILLTGGYTFKRYKSPFDKKTKVRVLEEKQEAARLVALLRPDGQRW